MSKKLARWFADLCKGVAFHTNGEEMKKLCTELNIDYDQFDKMSANEISLEVGGAMLFRNQVGKLLDYLRKNKPRVQPYDYHALNWGSIGDQADVSLRIGDPLLGFLGSGPLTIPEKGAYTLWYHELIDVLTKYYDNDEFRKMCMDLRINYLLLADKKAPERASEFVRILIAVNGIRTAVTYCQRNRPRVQPMWVHSIPWNDIVERAAAAFKEGNPLHDPILAKRIQEKH